MFIIDEAEYSKKLLEIGFIQPLYRMNTDLLILAKYLFYIGKDKVQVEKDLIEFCHKFKPLLNTDQYYEIIINIVNNASKSNIRIAKPVPITMSEINAIDGLKDKTEKTIAFTALVIYKICNNNPFKISWSELFRIAKSGVREDRRLRIIQNLFKYKMMSINVRNGKYSILFCDRDSEAVVYVSDFDNIPSELNKIINRYGTGDKKYCIKCGKTIKSRSVRKKYCEDCLKEIRKEQIRIAVKKHYYSNTIEKP